MKKQQQLKQKPEQNAPTLEKTPLMRYIHVFLGVVLLVMYTFYYSLQGLFSYTPSENLHSLIVLFITGLFLIPEYIVKALFFVSLTVFCFCVDYFHLFGKTSTLPEFLLPVCALYMIFCFLTIKKIKYRKIIGVFLFISFFVPLFLLIHSAHQNKSKAEELLEYAKNLEQAHIQQKITN